MGRVEFTCAQKALGSPVAVAYDEEGQGLSRATLLMPRRHFAKGHIPKTVSVVVEWEDEVLAGAD